MHQSIGLNYSATAVMIKPIYNVLHGPKKKNEYFYVCQINRNYSYLNSISASLLPFWSFTETVYNIELIKTVMTDSAVEVDLSSVYNNPSSYPQCLMFSLFKGF